MNDDDHEMSAEPTQFANIDLELYDTRPLDEFIVAWDDDICVLYHGEWGQGWQLSIEVSAMASTPEDTAREFIRLIHALTPALRERWDALQDRVFDLGVNAGLEPRMWNTSLSPEMLVAIGELGARLVFTVYAPITD
jgi:hypothetical protein